nr:AzlD domain-containing protein [Alkalicoccus chagannorensis]
MNEAIFWMIIGMAVVTYIPRMLPLTILSTEGWPEWLRRMLGRVPYAVLGALIFPGILYAMDSLLLSVAGGAAAVVLAWRGAPLLVVVAGTILLLTALQFMIG